MIYVTVVRNIESNDGNNVKRNFQTYYHVKKLAKLRS